MSTRTVPECPQGQCQSVHRDSVRVSTGTVPECPQRQCQSVHKDCARVSTRTVPECSQVQCRSVHKDSALLTVHLAGVRGVQKPVKTEPRHGYRRTQTRTVEIVRVPRRTQRRTTARVNYCGHDCFKSTDPSGSVFPRGPRGIKDIALFL